MTSLCLVATGIFFAIRLAKSLHKPIDQVETNGTEAREW